MPDQLRLEVTEEPADDQLGDLRAVLLADPLVRARYPSADMWLVSVDLLDKDEAGDGEFRAVLADMAGSDTAVAYGRLADPYSITVTPTLRPRFPSEEEHAWALGVLRQADPDLARRIDEGEVDVYRPMPPLANMQGPSGSVLRAVTVGLRERLGEG